MQKNKTQIYKGLRVKQIQNCEMCGSVKQPIHVLKEYLVMKNKHRQMLLYYKKKIRIFKE